MSRGIIAKSAGTIILFLVLFVRCFPQDDNSVRIMFYNVENLFDINNDSLTDDDEFLPDGIRRWTYSRYRQKLNSVYKTIMAAGEWEPPVVIAFCEIENKKVLEDLLRTTGLNRYDYEIIHEESPDPRGIDVCLIYRKKFVKVIDYNYLIPDTEYPDKFLSRSVLYLKMKLQFDTVHLFVNHWPSRRGGVLAAEEHRIKLAEMIRGKSDEIFSSEGPDGRIIMTGDFNCNPDDNVLKIITSETNSDNFMVNLSGFTGKTTGSYRYRGTWELFDQVLVSVSFLRQGTGIYTLPGLMRILKADFLMKEDLNYPGKTPFSTYSGYRYQGGYSDHLPVLIDFMFR